jgi:hypothetical protein
VHLPGSTLSRAYSSTVASPNESTPADEQPGYASQTYLNGSVTLQTSSLPAADLPLPPLAETPRTAVSCFGLGVIAELRDCRDQGVVWDEEDFVRFPTQPDTRPVTG